MQALLIAIVGAIFITLYRMNNILQRDKRNTETQSDTKMKL